MSGSLYWLLTLPPLPLRRYSVSSSYELWRKYAKHSYFAIASPQGERYLTSLYFFLCIFPDYDLKTVTRRASPQGEHLFQTVWCLFSRKCCGLPRVLPSSQLSSIMETQSKYGNTMAIQPQLKALIQKLVFSTLLTMQIKSVTGEEAIKKLSP